MEEIKTLGPGELLQLQQTVQTRLASAAYSPEEELEGQLEQALAENKALRKRMAQRDLYIWHLEERLTEQGESG